MKIQLTTVAQTGKLDKSVSGFISEDDYKKIALRLIDYKGAGMYSLDDDKVYRIGKFATYSRIRMS